MKHKNASIKQWSFVATSIILGLATPLIIHGNIPFELQKAIEDKNKTLQEVTTQLQTAQQILTGTTEKSKSLKQELQKINRTINQLNLGIRSSELTIEKLNLEISSLQYEIHDAETTSQVTRSGIGAILQSLYEKDNEHMILVLLKKRTLEENFQEIEQLMNLNDTLRIETNKLTTIKTILQDKMGEREAKRTSVTNERKTLTVRKELVADQKQDSQTLLVQTKNQEQVYQQMIATLEKQQESIVDEITKIEDELRATFDASLLPGKRPGVFAWPIKLTNAGGVGRITQHAGEKSRLYRGKPHNGLDIGANQGTPVYAAEDGTVIAINNNDRTTRQKYQYGKYVMIKHNNNLSTLYAHLSRNNVVSEGAIVKRGDLIGYSGNTGYSTGPHLHFGVYWSASVIFKTIAPAAGVVPIGVIVNPEDYL